MLFYNPRRNYEKHLECLSYSLEKTNSRYPLVILHDNEKIVNKYKWKVHVSYLQKRLRTQTIGRRLYT